MKKYFNGKMCGLALIMTTLIFSFAYSSGKIGGATTVLKGPKNYGDVVVSEIVDVYDGDTFHINIKDWPDIVGKRIGVRVIGIDSPEMHDKDPLIKLNAIKAKEYAHNILTTANEVKLINIKRDKYFRILATVLVDGRDFSKIMLDSGLAKEYDGGTKDQWSEEDISKLEKDKK